jgi:hypothetical protein
MKGELKMKSMFLIVSICLTSTLGCSSDERISALLRATANGGPVPSEKMFDETVTEDYVRNLSPDGVKEFLPLAAKLLSDPRLEARDVGLRCLMAVTLFRWYDSEALIEPYVPGLLLIADDRASPLLRNTARYVLGNTRPKMSQKALVYTAANLTDKSNTVEEIGAMACALLRYGSPPVVHDVFAYIRSRGEPLLDGMIVSCIRNLPNMNSTEILDFIGASLDNPNSEIRRIAVEAVARLPMDKRSPFLDRLGRMSTDPKETDGVRSAVREALK